MRLLLSLVPFFVWLSPAVSQTISQSVIKDFSVNFYVKQRVEKNENLSAIATLAGQRLDYGIAETQIAVEQLDKNVRFREEVFKTICQLYKSD